MSRTRPLVRRQLLLAAACALALPAVSQPLSDKPIRILVGAPAGGTADILARLVGDGLSRGLGQTLIVDNKPGALGAIVMETFMPRRATGRRCCCRSTACSPRSRTA
jgi:tripartite-type tricarboxylate transporter receptor subunit TctC